MSESFVDLSYRGLALARRVKLTQVRPSTGYVEMPTPMPVGTHVAITTDDGVAIEAIVAEIHEQIAGATHTPGMLVKPALDGAGADWWKARVVAPDPEPPVDPDELRRTDPMVPTTIVGKRRDRTLRCTVRIVAGMQVGIETVTVVLLQTAVGTDPDQAAVILQKRADRVLRQSLFGGERLEIEIAAHRVRVRTHRQHDSGDQPTET